MYVLNPPVFNIFISILWSEFNKNTDIVYLKALIDDRRYIFLLILGMGGVNVLKSVVRLRQA